MINKIILSVFVLLCINAAYAQEYKRKIVYSTEIHTEYSVPNGVDVTTISDYDLLGMQSSDLSESAEITVDRNNKVVVERFFHNPMRYNDDYEFMTSRALITSKNVILYDAKDVEIQRTAREGSEIPQITNEMIPHYGFYNNMFKESPRTLIPHFARLGYKSRFIEKQGILEVYIDTMLLILDFNKFKYITKFSSGGQVVNEEHKYYREFRGMVIPDRDVSYQYKRLDNDILLQQATITDYTDYSVYDERGRSIVEFRRNAPPPRSESIALGEYEMEEQLPFGFTLYPNPSQDVVNVKFDEDNNVVTSVEVINLLGTVLYKNEHVTTKDLKINIEAWSDGVYLIRCKSGDEIKTMRLIKN